VVAEMMGGSHPAYDFSKACLEAGKHVITSNKEVVSNFGVELCSIAAAHGVRYLFEASVGGGIPVIRPMINDLASNKITKICGILNGTTNYILTKMRDEGASFADALAEAQKLGYAEANPSADVDGIDAARKIVILAALASGKLISPKSIYTEGITAISLLDTKIAESMGYSIKLIGQAHVSNDGLSALVSPCMVPNSNPLSRIDDVFNGILIDANMVGEVMFYGPGAGKLPTASAVVADIIDVIAHMGEEQKVIAWEEAKECDLADFERFSCKRVFISSAKLDLPCVKQFVTLDGAFAYLTDEMTETEVERIKAENSAVISVFRAL
ncbi:MAG: homoserine dehydrogenase, partial [Clostridia bacterium]|nr:homoserine dehydrogenase [Clostridia bacterium]